jgi:hypothetical protein
MLLLLQAEANLATRAAADHPQFSGTGKLRFWYKPEIRTFGQSRMFSRWHLAQTTSCCCAHH